MFLLPLEDHVQLWSNMSGPAEPSGGQNAFQPNQAKHLESVVNFAQPVAKTAALLHTYLPQTVWY